MPLNWVDVSSLSFNTLLLLERAQLSWFPGWLPEPELAVALDANPAVAWYLRHKCPDIVPWLDRVMAEHGEAAKAAKAADAAEVRRAEVAVLGSIGDLVTYAVDPAAYDAQPFLQWDSQELLDVTDFAGKTVLDVGAGTGRLALTVADVAAAVFAVEPVANLRHYLKAKARARGLDNVYPVDGLVTDLPFPDGFADIVMGGHVFGDDPEDEAAELERVAGAGGLVILCPGNGDADNEKHVFLVDRGYAWGRFEQPGDGWKRKYWRTVG